MNMLSSLFERQANAGETGAGGAGRFASYAGILKLCMRD